MNQGFALDGIPPRLANVSLIGLDTTATQLGISNVHLFQPPLPVSCR